MEANKIDHVILETVDKQLVEGRSTQPAPSPTKTTEGGASVLTRATSPPIGRTGRHLAALGPSEEPQAVSTWLRQYRRIADYSSISQTRSFFMGRPPEENATIANMVPRLEYNLKARQLQRIKFGEVLSTGGARYPLMEHKRDADKLYEVHGKPLYELEALEAVATSPRGTAPIDAFDQDAHWSQRLAMVPTHAMLAKQATKPDPARRKHASLQSRSSVRLPRQAAARRRRRRDARHGRVQVDPRDGLEPAVGVADALDQRVPLRRRPLLILIRGEHLREAEPDRAPF